MIEFVKTVNGGGAKSRLNRVNQDQVTYWPVLCVCKNT